MPTRQELEQALINADAAGDTQAATALADALASGQYDQQAAEPSTIDRVKQAAGYLPAVGVLETAATLGSGMAGTVAGGLAGAVATPFVGAERGAEIVKGTQEALTYQPKTPAGQAGIEAVGKAADVAGMAPAGIAGLATAINPFTDASGADVVRDVREKGVGGAIGDKVYEETGSPLWGAIATASPEAVASAVPFLSSLKRSRAAATATEQAIANKIAQGSTETSLVKYMVDDVGKLATDKAAKEAIKQGYREGVVQVAKSASKTDRAKMAHMLDILERGKKDALYAAKNRPTDVVGHSVVRRVRFMRDLKKQAADQMDDVASSLKGQRADFAGPVNNFLGELEKAGVTFDDAMRPNFSQSDFQGLSKPQGAIRNLVSRMKDVGKVDAFEMHRLKKYIDNVVDYGKEPGGAVGNAERMLKKLRSQIDDSLDSSFPEYNRVNTQYRDAVSSMDALQKAAGKSIDLDSDKALGTTMRRLLSNVQSRSKLIDSIDDLNSVSKRYGANFDDDIMSQVMFADELDSMFGPAARTSLAGETAKGARQAMQGGVREMAVEKAAGVLEKARGINEENAIKVMREILERGKE